MFQPTDSLIVSVATQIVDTAPQPLLFGGELNIYTAPVNPGPNTLVSDLSLPTYGGYAGVPIVWGAPHQVEPGIWEVAGTAIYSFAIGGGDPPQVIAGCAISNAGFTNLYLANDFPIVYTLQNSSQQLAIALVIRVGDPESWGAPVVVVAP